MAPVTYLINTTGFQNEVFGSLGIKKSDSIKSLSIAQVSDTPIIEVVISGYSPDTIKAVANSIIDLTISRTNDMGFNTSAVDFG